MENLPVTPVKSDSSFWYVWYTKPRAEKKVRDRLAAKGIEVFLPLRKELRKWSDRKKWVETPLFSGYIFTRVTQREWDAIAYTEGVLTFVRFNGKPAVVREAEISYIKALNGYLEEFDIIEQVLQPGEPIEIIAGPFMNMQGQVVNYRGSSKLAVTLEQLGKTLLIQVPQQYIKSLKRA